MGLDDHLVKGTESVARRHEEAGGHVHYLSYGPITPNVLPGSNPPTQIIKVRLPKNATNISLHGPGNFDKHGKGSIYGVRITFTEEVEGKGQTIRTRTIELPHPSVNVQLLDREPDEAYRMVA